MGGHETRWAEGVPHQSITLYKGLVINYIEAEGKNVMPPTL